MPIKQHHYPYLCESIWACLNAYDRPDPLGLVKLSRTEMIAMFIVYREMFLAHLDVE